MWTDIEKLTKTAQSRYPPKTITKRVVNFSKSTTVICIV